jgi:FkbM family methyltransferase
MSIQGVLRRGFVRYFGSWMAERTKRALRAKVMALPIARDYPFDVEAKLLRSIGLQPSAMLDIGANTGVYSAILEDVFGSENLYLFEPLPHLHRYLKRRFPKAHVFDFGLTDKQDKQCIRVPYINGKRFDTRATCNTHTELNQTGFDEFEVQFFPLDEVARRIPLISLGFVKIDVEGHELEVLDGAVETLTRFKPLVLIEIESRHHPFPITRTFSRLEAMGYRGYYVNPETFEILKIAHFDSDRDQDPQWFKSRNFAKYLNNFFFVSEASEQDFTAKAAAFLEAEKRLA